MNCVRMLLALLVSWAFCDGLTAAGPRDLAAKVGPDGISVGEVEREMRSALGDRKVLPEEQHVLQAQTLGLLVNRQLVLQYLESRKSGATTAEIDAQIERMEAELKRRQSTLEDQLAELGIAYTELRRALAWETGWPKYLRSKMTPENIQKYFDQHRRDFDGTKLHVAHLLLKVETPQDPNAVKQVVQTADALRTEILSGKTNFADAAKKHGQSPTADRGGDIGLIQRREPMPEPFSAAAFGLKVGETSEPVVTSFGVHLIHLLGEEPGKGTLDDPAVEQAVREDLIRYLFLWVSEKQRADAKIEFTGVLPYIDPTSGEFIAASEKK